MVLVKVFTFMPVCYGLTNEVDQRNRLVMPILFIGALPIFLEEDKQWDFSNGRYIRAAIFDKAVCRLLVFYPKIW